MKKYSSFTELTQAFALRVGTALEFINEDGMIISVSYAELAVRIMQRADELCKKGRGTDIVYATSDIDAVVELFASAVACRCILNNLHKTTNRSKVVRLSSRTLCCSAWSGQSMLACGEGDRILSVLPLSHVFGFVCSLLWGLAYGATVCLGSIKELKTDTSRFRPTIIPAVPSIVEALLRYDAINPQLRIALIGAAPCSEATSRALNEKGIRTYYGYGLTETSSGIAITQDHDEPFALHLCPGADVRIEFDGEISVSTPCMMKGYLGREPMFENGRFYTGDLGWFDEKGRLHLKGRKKDVLLMDDGSKIFCPEYEEDLMEKTGLPDIGVTMKDGQAVLVAGSLTNDTAIAKDLRSKILKTISKFNSELPHSQQIHDVIVRKDALPRTATGKLKRHELQEQIESK